MHPDFFNKFIYPVRDKLYRFAWRITGDAAEAEDVVQDVFAKIWQQTDKVSVVQNWEAWCMTLTRNHALNRLKVSQNKPQPLSNQQFLVKNEGKTPDEALSEQDVMENIQSAMQQLPENHRICMHLRDIEEFSYDEIATMLNMTDQQVKTNIHRARKAMRSLIDKTLLQKQ